MSVVINSPIYITCKKDPYNFDFLSLSKEVQERDLEKALISHIRDFLLELGLGFAFVAPGDDFALPVLLSA
ncbi:hypothetical protein DSM106972_091290 [Dulcicalothrix desertica PCC 7102]|uniref:YhcG PDDEXK nuclease domain-containing protein n=1 Tax=Dulcicalothrix desertica PCC 7102 TaxID=232991 RepID=A0A433UN48_9CYAN|nr:PDDEXK nuclease domain-containing protein [Dulcicalothrix desertica]RUS95252.1 hypothetical protein DSM106972_091290 [Dulcicalothrix desertica PCC 7102]